jgi:hypothetical protein
LMRSSSSNAPSCVQDILCNRIWRLSLL